MRHRRPSNAGTSWHEPVPWATGHAVASHVSSCAACAQFAARHQAIDVRLVSALVLPAMTPLSPSTVRARESRDAVTTRRDTRATMLHCPDSKGKLVASVPWD